MNTNRPNQNTSRPNKNSPDKVKEPRPKAPGVELQLVGKRVKLTNNDWSKAIVGTLKKVEKYLYVVDTNVGTIIVMKHSVGSISGAKEDSTE